MPLWKQLLLLIMLTGLGAGGWWAYETYGPAPSAAGPAEPRSERLIQVEAAAAARTRVARTVEAVGTARAARSVQIVPLASGRIVALDITSGREVGAGEVLARLDDEIQKADLQEATAQLAEKRLAMERAEALRRRDTVSAATLEQARSEVASAEASLDRARRRLADRQVRSPFAGIVGMTNTDIGARVDENTVLATLDDLATVEVEFALPETLFGQIRIGQPIAATSVAFPGRSFAGKVAAVDVRIDSASRAFKVRAAIDNRDRVLPAGMFLLLSLTLEEAQALVVPEAAIVAQGARSVVFVIADGRANRRVVGLGQRLVGKVELVEGVKEGELVAVSGLQSLRDKAKVKLVEPRSQAPRSDATPAPRAKRTAG